MAGLEAPGPDPVVTRPSPQRRRAGAQIRANYAALFTLALLTACAHKQPVPIASNAHVPPFATVPYEPISRTSVVAITLREWRLFGQPVDDEPPGTRPPPLPEDKPERQPGLWQRVGEYWWLGMNAGTPEAAWTGKHDASGLVFPADEDALYAWSAAFVSYVMRIAGAGPHFPYSESHSTYIDIAKQMADHQTTGWIVTAERPSAYAPQPGDLICMGRGLAASLTYDALPAGHFPAHCDIVVANAFGQGVANAPGQSVANAPGQSVATVPGQISVVGGNVDDAVTMKHVPVTADGKLATPDRMALDTRYPWMVVLRVLYPPPPNYPPVSLRGAKRRSNLADIDAPSTRTARR
jgi:hypothetical protein